MGGSLAPAGPVAAEMATLWWALLALGAAGFVIFAVLLGLALRRRHPGPEEPDPQAAGRRSHRLLVGAGVVQPLVFVIATFALTVVAMRAIPEASDVDADAVVVDVVGHQWWYEIRYPDLGVVTANEVHIPAGQAVRLRLRSADVIHSFWVPQLAGKIDLIPDYVNELVLIADGPGTYLGDCAEFCGLSHTWMGIRVVAHPPEEFDSWVQAQAAPAEPPTGAVAMQGQEVFLQSTCAQCHTIAGTPADGAEGPDLTHLASRATLAAGTIDNDRMALEDWLTDPHAIKDGVEMPPAEVDGDQLDALLTYLEGLQ